MNGRRGSASLYVIFGISAVLLTLGNVYFKYRRDLQRYQNPWQPAHHRSIALPHLTHSHPAFHPHFQHAARLVPTYVITGSLRNRRIVHKVMPEYPQGAEEQGFTGKVRLSFRVNDAGEVYPNIWVTQTVGYPDFESAAVQALKHWKFAPAKNSPQVLPPGDITPEATPGQPGVISFNFTI